MLAIKFAATTIKPVKIDFQRLDMVANLISELVNKQQTTTVPAAAIMTPPPVTTAASDATTSSWTTERMPFEAVAYDLFTDAKRFAQSGETQEAITVMQDILERFPDTHAAELAQRGLENANTGSTCPSDGT